MLLKTTIALTASGLLLAAVPVAVAPAYAAPARVAVKDDFFDPKVKTVRRGATVLWVNVGGDSHTVTTRRWSRRLDPGEQYSRVVRRGFGYYCKDHGNMTGRIRIG
jgi:plastocyanin